MLRTAVSEVKEAFCISYTKPQERRIWLFSILDNKRHFFYFQFLERKYAYFHCKDCKTRWESAYVWCISGTSKVSKSVWDMDEGWAGTDIKWRKKVFPNGA